MKTTILITGKTTDKHTAALLIDYIARMKKYCACTAIEIPDIRFTSSASSETIRKKEYAEQKKYFVKSDYIILLDEAGKQFTSKEFAAFITQKQLENRKHLVFIIGGSYGFAKELYAVAHEKISLSPMTFPHQLVRVIFAEQLYRAFTIMHNEQYHH